MELLIAASVIIMVFLSGFMSVIQTTIAGITGMDETQSFMFSLVVPAILIAFLIFLFNIGLGKRGGEGAWGELGGGS